MEPSGEGEFLAKAMGQEGSAQAMEAAASASQNPARQDDSGTAKGGGGIGEMKSIFKEKMEEVRGRMDDVKDRMEDAVGTMQATNMKGAVVLSNMSAQSGNQLITRFLHMSLSSSKSRRGRSSEATAQLAQALLVKHSRPALEPVYFAVADIFTDAGLHIIHTTIETIIAFLRHQLRCASLIAKRAGRTFLELFSMAKSAPDNLSSRLADTLLWKRLVAGCLLLCAVWVLGSFVDSREMWYAMAAGFAVSLGVCFSYHARRGRRAMRSLFLSADFTQGGPLQNLFDYLGIAAEDNVAGDGRIVHQGVGWLNALLSALWPKLAHHIGRFLLASSNELMHHFKPSFLTHLGVTRCELGNLPIDIRRLKINTLNSREIDFEVAATWEGQVAIDLVMDVPGARFETDVRKLQFKGEFRIVAGPLVPVFPGFAAVRVSLTKPPQLDFQVNIKSRLSPPAVVSWLKRFIRETIDDLLLWPNRMVIPLLQEDHPHVGPYIDPLLMKIKGIVKIKVLAAEDLPDEDTSIACVRRGSDPYVVLDTSRAEFCVTSTKHNTMFPAWNETYFLRVFETSRPVHFEVWDADMADSDDLLGRCSVNLLDIQPGTLTDRWYPLGRQNFHDVEGTGDGFGRIRLGIKWWPMDHLTCNLGSGWVNTEAEEFDPKCLGPVQRGCVLMQLIKCSGLPCEKDRVFFQADGCIEGEQSSSLMVEASDGAPEFFYNANFYDVPVTSKLVMKVYGMAGSRKSRRLLGLLNLPLSFPAMSERGILRGNYALSGAKSAVATVQVQWLPLDCNELPFPPMSYDDKGYLSVHLDSAHDLINTDAVGLSDPFVTFKLGAQKQLSSCKEDTLTPVWHEDFDFPDVSTSDILHVHVKDKDRFKSDNLGEVFLPVIDIVKHCFEDSSGRWAGDWPLAGVPSGSVRLSLYWDAGNSAAEAISLDGRLQQLQKQGCVAPLDPRDAVLPRAFALPQWWLNTEVTWAELKTLGSDKTCPRCKQDLHTKPSSAPRYPSSLGKPSPSSANPQLPGKPDAGCCCQSDSDEAFKSAQRGVETLKWDVVMVLHGITMVDGGSATPPDSQAPAGGVSIQMCVEDVQHTSSRKTGHFTWKEGFAWQRVALDSEAEVQISVLMTGPEGKESSLGKLSLPLAAVRLAPSRMISGSFSLTGADGQRLTNLNLALEIAYIQHVAMRRQLLHLTSATGRPTEAGTLHVLLESGDGLPAADANGSSDPYCTLKAGGVQRTVSSVKKKTLNPVWNEAYTFDGLTQDSSLHINVWDKDRVKKDLLGTVDIPVSAVLAGKSKQLRKSFPLKGVNASGNLTLSLQWSASTAANSPRRGRPSMANYSPGPSELGMDSSTRQIESLGPGTLKVLLKSGRELLPMDSNGLSDPYCTMKVGRQRQVSKVKARNLNPQWCAMFSFMDVDASDSLRINVWDKDYVTKDLMGSLQLPVSRVAQTPDLVVDDEWELTLDGKPAGYLQLAMTWATHSIGEKDVAGNQLGESNTYTSAGEARGNDQFTRGNIAGDPIDSGKIASEDEDTDCGSPSQQSASSPASAFIRPVADSDKQDDVSNGSKSFSSGGIGQRELLSISNICLTRLPEALDGSLYISFKLGRQRRATRTRLSYHNSDEGESKVVWHPDISFQCAGDASRQYLRARLYRRSGPLNLKAKVGEVQIALNSICSNSNNLFTGSWPLSGGSGLMDVTIVLQ